MNGRKRGRGVFVAVLALLAAGSLGGGAAHAASGAADADCVVRISTYRVDSTIQSDWDTVLRTVVRNCTGQSRHVTLIQYGTEPEGCPVLDPISREVDIPPTGSWSHSEDVRAPACPGRMRMYLHVYGRRGTELDHATTSFRVTPA
jgi:hypothetical protein